MNTNNIKKYAPKARKAFIEAMSKQAAKYGITKKKIEPAEQKGDLVLIGDRPFPASVIKPRERLVKRIEQQGFDQVMEHVAYSWFNRLCAIRYMERKGFLDHGRRVLSAADGSSGVPQILEECSDVELPGLEQAKVRELKLDGTKDEELYRELLLAQCHALHQAMPFLFEAVADESELLLPENLTRTDSLIRDLVASVPDEDWDHIEIIGWLYQFYISEKKDQVIGKVVKSEDIPAATQLFTPNWIVQYLVQNSVGRQWLQTYPDSPLKAKMPYYIEPAEQTPEVQAQLAAMAPKELKPEELSVMDPACGSAHLITEAYRVLKAIYEERGYRTRDIPQLILENNLYGLDIDDRAGQLAAFALMMLAREDDRRIFSRNIRLNVLSLQESANVNLLSLWQSLNLTGEWKSGTSQGLFEEQQQDLSDFTADNRYQLLQKTLERFKQAKTLGSLIDVPHDDHEELKELFVTLCELESAGDSMQKVAATQLIPYVHQAVLLAQKYDAVVANPPYMGAKFYTAVLKSFVNTKYKEGNADLYSVFTLRNVQLVKNTGYIGMITIPNWMFLKSFEKLRDCIFQYAPIISLVHNGRGVWGSDFGSCSYILQKDASVDYVGKFLRLFEKQGSVLNVEELERRFHINKRFEFQNSKFTKIPGHPIAYWVSSGVLKLYESEKLIGGRAKKGLTTGDNEQFLRFWWEVSLDKLSVFSGRKWFPTQKGGEFRRWFGNYENVINWENNGEAIKSFKFEDGKPRSVIRNPSFYFKPGITWSDISIGMMSFRYVPEGFVFNASGPTVYSESNHSLLAFFNSRVAATIAEFTCPTVHFEVGQIQNFPEVTCVKENLSEIEFLIETSKKDWDSFERSWNFTKNPIVSQVDSDSQTLLDSYNSWVALNKLTIDKTKYFEEENNRRYIQSCQLSEELSCDVPLDQISLTINPVYRYGGNLCQEELATKFRESSVGELVLYVIGCMFGRYSLDREGLVYAHAGNEIFTKFVAEGAFRSFCADDDGIIPLTDQEWFPDDATNRFREFVKVAWGEEHLQENLDFVAESLCLHALKPKKSESSMDTIRRYLSTQFYKDHLKTYKKRPIYWLFSSGKQKAFECLVYLHRYNEGTLSRMRTEYVIPLTAKMAAYAQKLENDKEASGSAAEVKRLEKEIAQLHKQQAELSEFDEKLRHYADQRISLDLDDGVKVNYGKFGDLLAEVKAITGEAPEVLS
ncbi:BREX-1 system adenine-specific DNA-methyltransferase PglX [Dasania sp. GY-19]|uniref:site-specific DNA-methyltransferase (adenine-specific) n=1 Tax=Dasania phycosphaerae TaxID=2950436 RepID=A0A9J6RSJ1_9GAMM|nr:BREX-1 system adenine-specific DNA-methyltransferase PglX [Dasania phycosphaerae]MCZ0867151.1 BREX-1 system adenine-specific DNA-methyltransferase PglX [Dasania phycosphaerae]